MIKSLRKTIWWTVGCVTFASVYTPAAGNNSEIGASVAAALPQTHQDRVDTVYYTKEGDRCTHPAFAEKMVLILYAKDTLQLNKFRAFYNSGELYEEGTCHAIGEDGRLSRDGEIRVYYKSGKDMVTSQYKNGLLNGPFVHYYENGLVREKVTYVDNKYDGIRLFFPREDAEACVYCEYIEGEYKYPYYTMTLAGGFNMKFDVETEQPIIEEPQIREKMRIFEQGREWQYYKKNGIAIFTSAASIKQYGKYMQVAVYVINKSPLPITFYPDDIHATYSHGGSVIYQANALTCDQYMKIVNRRQNWNVAMTAVAAGLSAASAGYSQSTSTTNSLYRGQGYSSGSVSAFGSGGSAYGYYYDNSSYSGSGTSTTTTRSYDGAAAFQASIIAQNRINDYKDTLGQETSGILQDYLQQTTINPGESLAGYVNITYDKYYPLESYNVLIEVPIHTVSYQFTW